MNPVVKPEHNFNDLLKIKATLQLQYLVENKILTDVDKTESYSLAISDQCYNFAKNIIEKEKPILEELRKRYPMVLVSNFYGNVQAVIEDFGLLKFFDKIIESAVVGVRKPDPAIFGLGVEALGLPAENIVVLGDSHSKDIVPATKNGCQTVWLKGKGWGDDEEGATADVIITDFMQLKEVFQLS